MGLFSINKKPKKKTKTVYYSIPSQRRIIEIDSKDVAYLKKADPKTKMVKVTKAKYKQYLGKR